jgi:hypothetical protein
MSRGTEHATRQKRGSVSPCVPRHRACHPSGKGSGVVMCPNPPCVPLVWRGLRSYHVPRARHPAGEGSRVVTCLVAPGSPPPQGGSRVAAWLRHQDHRPTGLWYRYVSSGSRPASWCGRASEPPHVQCLSAPVCIRAFLRRLTSGPSWPR